MWRPGWEGSLGENEDCICMAGSLCYVAETITTLLIRLQYKIKIRTPTIRKEQVVHSPYPSNTPLGLSGFSLPGMPLSIHQISVEA